ncbi:MAG: hypothetical protein FWC28_08170 [Proteobacteria bacterium]|nr:hypothetical protein [Cystobacterineae bacterium]MCL2258454.1 hypothetical protein [Cystobacterineae bacterium]MCL2315207.1 hypothetical protein [Pseudomonadota bacterium]
MIIFFNKTTIPILLWLPEYTSPKLFAQLAKGFHAVICYCPDVNSFAPRLSLRIFFLSLAACLDALLLPKTRECMPALNEIYRVFEASLV